MNYEELLAELKPILAHTVELARETPSDLAIPTCGDWRAGDLWEHLGIVHRWATHIVSTGAQSFPDRNNMDFGIPNNDDWSTWLAHGAESLLAAFQSKSGDEEVWVWGGDPHVRWWARRQVHETLIHNADAELALGAPIVMRANLAADCIEELLDNATFRMNRGEPSGAQGGEPCTIHLHASDEAFADSEGQGEWMIDVTDAGISYTREHAKGNAAVQGPVQDLVLTLNGRADLDADTLKLFGEEAAWDSLVSAVSL